MELSIIDLGLEPRRLSQRLLRDRLWTVADLGHSLGLIFSYSFQYCSNNFFRDTMGSPAPQGIGEDFQSVTSVYPLPHISNLIALFVRLVRFCNSFGQTHRA